MHCPLNHFLGYRIKRQWLVYALPFLLVLYAINPHIMKGVLYMLMHCQFKAIERRLLMVYLFHCINGMVYIINRFKRLLIDCNPIALQVVLIQL